MYKKSILVIVVYRSTYIYFIILLKILSFDKSNIREGSPIRPPFVIMVFL